MSSSKTPTLHHQDGRTNIILESISDGVFTVDSDWQITSFNRAAEKITRIDRKEAIGRHCSAVFRASMCETDCALRHTMETGKPIVDKAVFIITAEGKRIPISISTALLRDENGDVVGGVETFRDLSLVEELRKRLQNRFELDDLLGHSPAMQRILEVLPLVAGCDSTVLIQGETGTGKELLARAVHSLSLRREKPFVAINCGALPDTLLESELFGYKAGAFTGAGKDKPGRLALAEGGTIFLDEIGDMSPALQVKLLRVLQEKTYEPLGGTKPAKADLRVIVASNKDLLTLINEGNFRQDLYYRVNVVRLDLPPLRERKEDIPFLIEHFINRFNLLRGKEILGVNQEVLALLTIHDYPGNIRELENIIEHAFVICQGGLIEPRHLPENMISKLPQPSKLIKVSSKLMALEQRILMETLKRNRFNRLAAARELGIHKSTLFRKLKSWGMVLPNADGRSSRNHS
jgi:PAS domain S-box-containing protein